MMDRTEVESKTETPPQSPTLKRFFEHVTVSEEEGGGFAVRLDGRPVKTPAGQTLLLPRVGLAQALAKEWSAIGEKVDLEKLPLTKLANTAFDRVSERKEEVIEDMVRYASSDLICYRATTPKGLVVKQAVTWDPVVKWVQVQFRALFSVTEGVSYIEQRPLSLDVLYDAMEGYNPFQIAAMHVMTGLTGSALLMLAHVCGRLTLVEAWDAAHIDEDWQEDHWGLDFEAGQRRARRFQEMELASRFFHLA